MDSEDSYTYDLKFLMHYTSTDDIYVGFRSSNGGL